MNPVGYCLGSFDYLPLLVGTHHKDQADRATELRRWIVQQEQTLQVMYGEEVELSHSPLLLEEMEECFSETDWAALDFGPSPNRSSPAHTSSKPRRPRCKCSTPAAAAPAELVTPTAASPQLSTAAAPAELVTPTAASPQLMLTAASAEPFSPPPAAAEFLAGFSSCPGRRHRRRTAPTGGVQVDASYASTEGPPATAFSQRFPPVWVPSGQEIPEEELMRQRVRGFAEYLRFFPKDLDLMHLILEAEFLGRGWLDAPAPLAAGGPFAPLLEAVSAVVGSAEP
ncbi:hypothetical protein CRENBAI_006147 [Crenichthys baileyi]|uniref:Uncharacterized protein n=1 Tax=Crenichthys baileyi TaxID=28760 RepID=A0AAV9R3Y6_9TELE